MTLKTHPQKPSHHQASGALPSWTWHESSLLTLRERLLTDHHAQLLEASEPLEPDSNDPADCATDEFDHNLAFSILSQDEAALHEVDAALQRIRDGTYGVCEETGQPIPDERLRAVPWTRYRKEVQERIEKQGLVNRTHLAPASDVHGPLVRTGPQPTRAVSRHKTKAERRAANAARETTGKPE